MTKEESINPDESRKSEDTQESLNEKADIVPVSPSSEVFEVDNNIQQIAKNLADKEPEKLISIVDKYIDKQAEIAKIKEENRHREVITCEDNKHKSQMNIENTKRITIASLVAIVISCFIYAGFTKDSALPDKIMTLLVGAVAGAGGVSLLTKKDNATLPRE